MPSNVQPRRPESLVWLLGLCLGGHAHAVQLPVTLLPAAPAITVPAARPLAGIEGWRLHGVFSSSRSAAGWAMLSLGDGAAISVRVGDGLPGGIQVKGVERDHLWLQRGEEQALLYLQGAVVAERQVPDEPAALLSGPLRADVLPVGCAPYAAAGVPVEELITLGGCPSDEAEAAPE